jgi:hypothetical protein
LEHRHEGRETPQKEAEDVFTFQKDVRHVSLVILHVIDATPNRPTQLNASSVFPESFLGHGLEKRTIWTGAVSFVLAVPAI